MSDYAKELRDLVHGLAEAALEDEINNGQDIAAGMLGPKTSEWLRRIAERLSGERRRPTNIDPAPPLFQEDGEPEPDIPDPSREPVCICDDGRSGHCPVHDVTW